MIRPLVLVVDDSPEMLRYLRVLLESDLCTVETASSGAEAVAVLRSGKRPDVVLLDVQMPGMDGLETLGALRTLCPELKAIIHSGNSDPEQMRRAAQMGALSYLIKPVRHLYLSAAIERCLSELQPARPRAEAESNVVSFQNARLQ
jgi:CheY-like chemotaxis protein